MLLWERRCLQVLSKLSVTGVVNGLCGRIGCRIIDGRVWVVGMIFCGGEEERERFGVQELFSGFSGALKGSSGLILL